MWLYPWLGTELCPASAEFIIDDAVLSTPPYHGPKRLKSLRSLLFTQTPPHVIPNQRTDVSATTDPMRHWEKGLTELFAYAALARQQGTAALLRLGLLVIVHHLSQIVGGTGLAVREVGLFYPFSRNTIHVPIHDWDHRPLFDRVLTRPGRRRPRPLDVLHPFPSISGQCSGEYFLKIIILVNN